MNAQSSAAPPAPAPGTAATPWWERPTGPPTVPVPLPPAAVPPARAAPPPSAVPVPPPAAVPNASAAPPPAAHRAAPARPLDVRALLHPAEHSRLLLALSASAVVFGAAAMIAYAASGWTDLALYGGYVAAFGVVFWLGLQVNRSRLLGGAVRVSENTLPELQAVFDDVRVRLDYHKHVDVYVKDKVDGGSVMTSYLGTRLIQIEGGLVAELLGEERYGELTYLIGRHIGQLKARHERLFPVFLVLTVVDSLKFLQFFLAPYFRATAKSGDQIAAACCGDIRATAAMMNRLLAGRELGPRVAVKGVLDQAAIVRRRWLPRLAQVFMSVPHATNRYLNLLAFFARVAPEEINAWRATLDEATASRVTTALRASPNRRPPRRRPNPLSMLLALLITGALLAGCGWLIFRSAAIASPSTASSSTASIASPTIASLSNSSPSTAASTNGTPHAGSGPAPGPSGTVPGPALADLSAASRQLLARMPPGFAGTCQPDAVPAADAAQGADAEVTCQPQALGGDGSVSYVHYQAPGAVQRVYAGLTHGVPSGNCTSGDGQGTYRQGSAQPAGDYACYLSSTGHHEFVWTDDRLSILAIAASDSMPLADLYQWWLGDTGPE